jgi:hypothetical protein
MRFGPSIKNYKGSRKTTLYRQNSQSKIKKKNPKQRTTTRVEAIKSK